MRWRSWVAGGAGLALATVATLLVVWPKTGDRSEAAVTTAGGEPAASGPFVQGTESVATYSYANAVRESVQVASSTDSDRDGKPDLISVDLIRPREAADAGIKVPVILDPSPYYTTLGRGGSTKKFGPDGTITSFPLYYDNYFVPRGYAVAYVDLPGTGRSQGCQDMGGPVEVGAVVAVIDWLNGRRPGNLRGGGAASAAWSTGQVGLIGKSHDGAIADGVAATGVDGLRTIVPIAGLSSWYQNGHGDLLDSQHGQNGAWRNTLENREVCLPILYELERAAEAGPQAQYWVDRDFRRKAGSVKASAFLVHGLYDSNVRTDQSLDWWSALAAAKVPRRMWLAQQEHNDPFDYRRTEWVTTLHRWFDFWLHHLPNGVMSEPPVSIELTPGHWEQQPDWPVPGVTQTRLALRAGSGPIGLLGAAEPGGKPTLRTTSGLADETAGQLPGDQGPNRLVFLGAPLSTPVRWSGAVTATVRMRASGPLTVVARLLDVGRDMLPAHPSNNELQSQTCYGEATAPEAACFKDVGPNLKESDAKQIYRGHADVSGDGTWQEVTIRIGPVDAQIAAGHLPALVLTAWYPQDYSPEGSAPPKSKAPAPASDTGTSRSPSPSSVDVPVDLTGAGLTLPVVGAGTFATVSTPPIATVKSIAFQLFWD